MDVMTKAQQVRDRASEEHHAKVHVLDCFIVLCLQIRRPQSVTSELPRVGVSEHGRVMSADVTSSADSRNDAIHVYSHPRVATDTARSRSEGSRLNASARSGAPSANQKLSSKSAGDVSVKSSNVEDEEVRTCCTIRTISRRSISALFLSGFAAGSDHETKTCRRLRRKLHSRRKRPPIFVKYYSNATLNYDLFNFAGTVHQIEHDARVPVPRGCRCDADQQRTPVLLRRTHGQSMRAPASFYPLTNCDNVAAFSPSSDLVHRDERKQHAARFRPSRCAERGARVGCQHDRVLRHVQDACALAALLEV